MEAHFRKILISAVLLLFAVLTPACSAQGTAASNTSDRGSNAAPSQAPVDGATTLTVMAASSLSEAFTDLGSQFEAGHPGVQVEFNFAGSQQLAQQIAQGANADVFASANQKQMDAAVESGRIAGDSVRVFVENRLVVILPKYNPGRIASLQDLAKPGLKLVFAAKEVPAGQYSLDALEKMSLDPEFNPDFKAQVLANVVSYEENVKSVLSKVSLGEADAGIVYSSDVTGRAGDQVVQIQIPDHLNVIAAYPIAVLLDSPHPVLAQAFIDLALSDTGKKTLSRYGFSPR